MKIGICNDEQRVREKIVTICSNVIKKYNLVSDIIEFSNGMEILEYKEELDILVLDIEMGGISGIETKDRLQCSGSHTYIIFVTNHGELVKLAFGVNVVGFIEKKDLEEQLPIVFGTTLQMAASFVILEGEMNSKDIAYIEYKHNYSGLFFANGTSHLLKESISSLEEKLKRADFIRVHRSILVNMNYIEKIDGKQLYINGKKIAMSERLKVKARKKYEKFLERNYGF